MRNILLAAFAFCVLTAGSIGAQAQERTLRGLLGFTEGAIHLGADYEMKQSSVMGFGGYFFFQTDDEDANVWQVIALGANAPIHLLNDSNFDVYVAPGFGIAMVESPAPNGEDETTFGPSLKMGAEYKVNPTTKIGLQYSHYYNWFSDKVLAKAEYASAAATFEF